MNALNISVCMATYNGAKHIKEQIDSILCQEFDEGIDVNMKVIVSDDGSDDNTLGILEGYNDDRIKIYRNENKKEYKYNRKLLNATSNFGNALKHASGDYIFLSDQDDIWNPHKMERQIKSLREHGGCVCAHSLIYMDERGEAYYKKSCLCNSFLKMCRNIPIHGMSIAMTRDVLDSILPMPTIPQHDIFIVLWAKWNKRLFLDDSYLVAHRILDGHKNTSYTTGYTPWVVKLYYRLKIILYAVLR